MQTNIDVKTAIKKANLRHWHVAEAMGLHDSNFSKLLRHELPETEKKRILQIIENFKGK